MSKVDAEIRALKRELASPRARLDQKVRAEVMEQLAARGCKDGLPVAERRAKKSDA